MSIISRRRFFGKASAISTLLSHSIRGGAKSAGPLEGEGWELKNSIFYLLFSSPGGAKKTRLVHSPSGLALAEGDYSYSLEQFNFQEARTSCAPDGSSVLSIRGTALQGYLEIFHEFRMPSDAPWMEESITLHNRGVAALDLHDARCGFVIPVILSDGRVQGDWERFKLIALPYRREPNGHRNQYADFSLAQVVTEEYASELWTEETTVTSRYASEGWVLTDGQLGFVILKYSQKGMEWALLDRVLANGRAGFRWGGFGIYRGNPEHAAWLEPGNSHTFGVTRVIAYRGGATEGFYTFRREMADRGHGCPKGFDPPVHWNELYDNKLWWLPDEGQDDPAMRKKYYTLNDMKDEAGKAKQIGCQALYMDPGWDTSFASKIWDEARLGPYKKFTEMLTRDYGLRSSLHTPLSGWCNPSSYPLEANRMDRYGSRLTWDRRRGFISSTLCGASHQYLEETSRRLKALARDGAAYFMFDGTQYHGECWDAHHGHQVPARREEHVQAMCRLARMIHADHPGVLIEMHDPVVGGTTVRYAPTYYGHGRAPDGGKYAQVSGFDSVWAFELMWMPMEDLLSGRAVALYYYNLAYGLPLYIHIDLRTDNENAIVFWWNASTCRHLGIGGTHKDPQIQKVHKEAMATYRKLESFFKAGTFYGIDETVHVHVHPSESAAVINCFNLEDSPTKREVEFRPEAFGLDTKPSYKVEGVPSRPARGGYTLLFEVPPRGHQLAEVRAVER